MKSNLLFDASLNVNLGAELRVAPQWSIDVTGDFNDWTLKDGKRWKHWFVQPEVRYWLCDAMAGHFFAAHLIGGQYNMAGIKHLPNFIGSDMSQIADYRFQGWAGGAGIGYGYSWLLNRHWSIEAEIGIGWIYTRYDKYPCAVCGTKLAHDVPHNYFGPTKAAINVVYVF